MPAPLLLTLLLAQAQPSVQAQPSAHTPPPEPFPGAAIDAHVRAGRYLAALAEAERRARTDTQGLLTDLLGLVQSYVGLEGETAATFDALGATRQEALAASPVDEATALDAIPAIVAAARGRRIVILNESHHMPRHRAFALELARALAAEGFDTFAAEAFVNSEATATRGYPGPDTGYYTVEPVFGELVRGVLALGYRTVPYEMEVHAHDPGQDMLARIRERETQQAQNLLERVFARDPEARLLVHCGYSHATEGWVDPGGPGEQAWMAARLADLTGEDPLTIDQTSAMPRSEPAFESPHWRRAEASGRLDGPKVFRRADGTFVVTGSYAGQVDLQVFHPRARSVHGRPDWLARGRTAVPVPPELVPPELAARIPEGQRILLQAFHEGEGPDAIPADQFVVTRGSDLPRFLLFPGAYRLVLQDEAGQVLATHAGLAVE